MSQTTKTQDGIQAQKSRSYNVTVLLVILYVNYGGLIKVGW